MRNMQTLNTLHRHETYRLVRHSYLGVFLYPLLTLISGIIFLTLFVYPIIPAASPLAFFDLISLLQFFLLPYVAILGFTQERILRTHWTLLAWPVQTSQIIYAKFLAWLRLPLGSVLVCAFWLIAGSTWYSYDWGLIISGIIQVFFTASLTLALALYFSSILKRTWHAVFATQFLLLTWLFCDFILRKWQAVGFLNWFFNAFSYGNYVRLFQKGLVTSSTWTFFLGITFFLLRKSWKALESYRGQDQAHARILLPIIWALTLFFPLELDITQRGLSRLHPMTNQLLKQVKNPLYITYCYPSTHSFNQDILAVQNQLELYKKANSWVILRYEPLKNEKNAQELGLYNQNGLYAGVLIEYMDKGALIPLLLDADEVEYRVSSKLYQMFHGRARIVIRTGPQQAMEGYSLLMQALAMHFDIELWQEDSTLPAADAAMILSAAGLDSDAASQLFRAHKNGLPVFIGYSGVGIPVDEQTLPVRYGQLAADSYLAALGIQAGNDLVMDPEGFYFSGQDSEGRLVQQTYTPWPKGFGSYNALWRLILPIFSVPLWADDTWTPLLFSSVAAGVQEGPINLDPQSLKARNLPEMGGPYILIVQKQSETPLIIAGSETIFSNLAPTIQNFIGGELLVWNLIGQQGMAETKLSRISLMLMKRPYSAILDTGRFLIQVAIFILGNIAFIIFAIVRRVWYTKAAFR